MRTFNGFNVTFVNSSGPPEGAEFRTDQVAYFLEIHNAATRNLYHFFKDLTVILFSIMKKLNLLENKSVANW